MDKSEEKKEPEENKGALDLIKMLRDEASHVKDCFTKYSYYGLLFSSAVLSLIVKFQIDYPFVAFISIVIMIFLFSIARIGIYKYGTANRNYGYQLYLERCRLLDDTNSKSWKKYMLQIGWEEAMSTWRFVQATVFNHIYETRFYKMHSVKVNIKEPWFQPKSTWEKEVEGFKIQYHAGTYLRTMLNIIYLTLSISLLPMIVMIIQVSIKYNSDTYTLLVSFPLAVSVIYVPYRIMRNNSKVEILEEGILSIYSCAIMWQAVVTAHYIALENAQRSTNEPFNSRAYHKNLSDEAVKLLKSIDKIDKYIWGN